MGFRNLGDKFETSRRSTEFSKDVSRIPVSRLSRVVNGEHHLPVRGYLSTFSKQRLVVTHSEPLTRSVRFVAV